MTGLLTWLVGSLKSQKSITESTEDVSNNPESKETNKSSKRKLQQKEVKVRQRFKKSDEDPTFSTSLSSPIEDIIEETISEENTLDCNKQSGSKKGKVNKKLQKSENQESEDNIGYSFFKVKTVSKGDLDKKGKKSDVVDLNEDSKVDDIGFSFLPVKERGKKYKNKGSNVESKDKDIRLNSPIDQTISKSKSGISSPIVNRYDKKSQYKTTNQKKISIESVNRIQKHQHYLSSSLDTGLPIDYSNKSELKESKKVSAALSYASVVVNSVHELSDTIETITSNNLENETLPTELEIEQNLTISNSSSIEILNEKVAYNQIVEESSNDEVSEQTFTDSLTVNLINRDSSSKHSSICIIDNPEEFENIDQFSFNTQSENFTAETDSIYNPEISKTVNVAANSVANSSLYLSFERDTVGSNSDSFYNIEQSAYSTDSQSSYFSENYNSLKVEYDGNETINNFLKETITVPSDSIVDFQTVTSNKSQLGRDLQFKSGERLNELVKELEHQLKTENKDNKFEFEDNGSSVLEEVCVKQVAHTTEFDKSNQLTDPIVTLSRSDLQNEFVNQQKIVIEPVSHLKFNIQNTKEVIGDLTATNTIFTENNTDHIKIEEMDVEKLQQIRVLTLNDHEHQECTLYRLEKNWVMQFRIGPSLFGRKLYLYCNYPIKTDNKLNEFKRNNYQLLEWITEEGCENADDTAMYINIKLELAGSFHYYFSYEKGENVEKQGSGYILVDPVLKYGDNEDLPLDCIQCQTVLAKCLGSFSTWEKKLEVSKESGYNFIHFTPIQELGASNSSYSLSEQLKLNPVFKKSNGEMPTFSEIEKFITKMRTEWKVGSICDIVLNHTANESKWIQEHPEVTYNCVNCPYMRPAYLLDAAFEFFSAEVKKGVYEDRGIPPEVNCEDHLNAIRYHFRASILEPLKIHELFICDTNKLVVEFLNLARTASPTASNARPETEELKLIQDPEFRRLKTTIDMSLALKLYNLYWNDTFDADSRLKKCSEEFKSKLDSLNNAIINEINDYLTSAIENVIAGIRYFRVQHDGPKFTDITIKTPLVYRYFTDYGKPKTLKEYEDTMYSDNGKFLMAHNGWVMSSDPLRNFAAPDSKVYLKRELIAWGDSVKLRYGEKPEDCPYLWDHMKKYVEQTAKIFDGVRLDNCHSTPIPVAEYLLDCARRVRPDLYVVAELFTNSDMTDNIFVNRLGITSLIREALNAWDSHEQGRLVHRFGGSPVGSFYQPNIRPLVPSIAHALFLDQTHDNPSPIEKRSVFDLLPSTALVNMACCASGSNRGYDELVPHHIHVVDEDREYAEWTTDESLAMGNSKYVFQKSGIIRAKKACNDLHFQLGKQGFSQVYVDQMDADIVAVTRHCPITHQSYILVAYTAFGHPDENAGDYQKGIKPLRFEGVLDEIVLEANLSHISHKNGFSKFIKTNNFIKDQKWINGFSEYIVAVKQHIQVAESDIFEKVESGTAGVTQLNFKNFKPGSIVVVKTSLPESMSSAVKAVRNLINNISLNKHSELSKILNTMTLADLNRVIYRCGQEERDEGFGFDTYNIPNFGSMVYAGFQGFMSLLSVIRPNNDLGHPMCANLRDGNWMIDYIWKRLKLDLGTQELGKWFEQNTKSFNNIPRYLVPCYFDMVVTRIYMLLLERCHDKMSDFVKNGSTFVRGLALGSVQFAAYIKSADLPTLSPNLSPPKPPTRKINNENVQACVTLSAGLPHFSVGYMRNWGRDTFISLRGLFILTGRFQEAREHILGYAACLRHGLIPNLLDGGRNSRFNCRDALWWWLYCIKEYVSEAPDGIKILTDKVSRIFPTDDSECQPPGVVDQPLHDVIQEGLKLHFQGLAFRERNAGRQIDEHMTDQGFNNQIGVHPETGFIFGGNKWNCGTWMDKMGSSDKAGNRGKPATPRDGSAVELIGLSKSVVSWLAKLNEENKYPYKCVERVHKSGTITRWTFKECAQKIQSNFEKYFWVNSKPIDGEIRPDLINKRGIYKDSYGSSLEFADFQLRCNFPIAMVAAPELFTPSYAWEALNQAEKYLLGPLGMKTLDPEDWAYRGDYDNSNHSDDASVAHGFNYHQGPEWVWPVGFFLRAKLIFAAQNGALKETVAHTKLILSKHFVELQTSDWRGLPELTNSNGSYCRDSSRTQAWSMSCILEVLYDLQKIESSLNLLSN